MSIRASVIASLLVLTTALPAVAEQHQKRMIVAFKSSDSLPANAVAVIEKAGGRIVRALPKLGLVIAASSDPAFAGKVGTNSLVEAVSLDEPRPAENPLFEVAEDSSLAAATAEPAQATALSLTNDPSLAPLLPVQWNLHQIQAPLAWPTGALGDPTVTVAIVDTGLDYTHPELVGKVDLSRSVSFVPEEDAMVQALFPGAHPIADLHGVTTNYAGLIACNAVRTACIAPNVTLIGIKSSSFLRLPRAGDVISGIFHAAEVGADVIITSLSNVFTRTAEIDAAAFEGYKRAVQFAHKKGALVLANVTPPTYNADDPIHAKDVVLPAQSPQGVGVSAVNRFDELSDQTGYGLIAVDIASPGGRFLDRTSNLEDTVIGPCSSFSLVAPACQRPTPASPYRYIFFIGSIPATGQAAGVAALIDSRAGGALRSSPLRDLLYQSLDDIGPAGVDNFSGLGRVNAFKAALVPIGD